MTTFSGTSITVNGVLTDTQGNPEDAVGKLALVVVDPEGKKQTLNEGEIHHDGTGLYHGVVEAAVRGLWNYRWEDEGHVADEGSFQIETSFDQGEEPDLTDLRVLVPRARRACEGPYGAPESKPVLTDSQVYAMVADAFGEIVLYSGSLFGHELEVKERDPLVGFPTAWKTATMLNEWEGAVIVNQTALDYFFHLFRDMKISQSIKNEGTEWTYSLSANVLRNYLETLKSQRDMALEGIRKHKPVYDLYASNIRVRDQATVGILEWWDTVSPGLTGTVGVPGGQEAAVIPWTPGWSGPGFSPE